MDEINTNKNEESSISGNFVYILAFFVPLIIMAAIFMVREIYPFGDNCYLRSDMYHQYCPFFSELWSKIRNGDGLFYTWKAGLGMNFTALYGYYLSSPTNWFVGLFSRRYMIEMMNIIILLKLAASSLTCTYYITKHFNTKNISAAIFGMFYGLSGFIAAYSWNLMWLDCVLLLPLVFLGLERLINEDKCLLYTFTLGLTILSNYYISIMVCMSVVIYFIVLIGSMKVPEDKLVYVKKIANFALYSLLAGGMAAVLLLPEVYALEYTASSNINFPDVLERYFSFITIFIRHMANISVSTGLDHLPNIYCGVGIFILIPLYIMNKKISSREKILKGVALVIFLTAFNLNIPNFIWHGFHYPNSLPCRQSFIYIFLLLTMCYDAMKDICEYKSSQFTRAFWIVMAFFLYLGNSLTSDEMNFKVIYTNVIFIVIYFFIALLVRKKKLCLQYSVFLLFAVTVIECTMNMETTGYSTTSRVYYQSDYNSVKELTNKVTDEDESFYRISKYLGYRSKNDSAWHDFNGPSTFSSTAYASMSYIYGQLGLEHSTNAYAANGGTPFINSILDIKYLLSNTELVTDDLLSLVAQSGDEYVYKNNYTLPVGFMIPSDVIDKWDYSSSNPFTVQNNLVQSMTGITDMFTSISFDNTVSSVKIVPDTTQHIYLYVNNKSVQTVNVTIDGVMTTYRGINHGRMMDLGLVKQGSIIEVVDADDSTSFLQLLVYTMDTDKFVQFYNALADEGLDVTSYSDDSISGTITAKNDGLMYMAIPYDEGWTVKIDGKKTDYEALGDAFITVPVSAGEHSVELSYCPRGFVPGLIISIISLGILAGIIVYNNKEKLFKKKTKEINITEGTIPDVEVHKEEDKE